MTAWIVLFSLLMISLGVHTLLIARHRNSVIAYAISAPSIVLSVLLLLIRGDMGTDWIGYNTIYDRTSTLGDLLRGSWLGFHFEPGFQLYIGALKTVSLNSNWIPLGLYVVSMAIIFNKIRMLSLAPIPVVVMYTLLIYPHFFEQIRMAFVYSVGVYIAITYFFENKKKYIIAVLASTFQYIGIFYIFLLLFSDMIRNTSKYVSNIRSPVFLFLFIFSILLAWSFGRHLYDALFQLIAYLPGNIITYKLLSYHERVVDLDLSYRGVLLMSIMILFIMLRLQINRHATDSLINLFGLALWISIIVFLIFGHFNVLSHRVISMMLYPTVTVLIAVLSLASRRDFYIGFICLAYAIYGFYKMINNIGPYSL